MSYNVQERATGDQPSTGDKPGNALEFLIRGEPGDESSADALAAMVAYAPESLGDLKQTGAKIDESIPDLGWWIGTVTFGTGNDSTQKETGESEFSFDTTGGQFKIAQSKGTVSRYPAADAPDLQGVIGGTSDEAPEGVEITIPQYGYTITMYLADELVTDTYKGILYSLTGTKNNAAFKGLAAGENLFLGARGSKRGRGDWQIAFNFAGSPNATGLSVGAITGIAKKGWDYLWVRFKQSPVGTGANKVLAPVPQFVYVEKVYEDANHALLGIGT